MRILVTASIGCCCLYSASDRTLGEKIYIWTTLSADLLFATICHQYACTVDYTGTVPENSLKTIIISSLFLRVSFLASLAPHTGDWLFASS